jgi:hypothetical protein
MADRQLILALFPDELAADNAAVALKDSWVTEGDAIGILALDSDGELKQDKVGYEAPARAPRSEASCCCSAGGSRCRHHRRRGGRSASPQEPGFERCRQGAPRYGIESGGKAAVLAEFDTAPVISDRLTDLGGAPEAHKLSDEAVEAATAGVPAA